VFFATPFWDLKGGYILKNLAAEFRQTKTYHIPPLGAGKHIFLYQSLSRKRKCRGFNIGQLVLHPSQIIYPFVPSAIDLEARKKVGAKAYSIHQLPIGDFSSPSRHMWTVA